MGSLTELMSAVGTVIAIAVSLFLLRQGQQDRRASHTALGYVIGVQASSSMEAIAALTLGSIRAVTEYHALCRSAVPTKAHP